MAGRITRLSSCGHTRTRGFKTRLRRMQYRPALLDGILASTRLDLTRFCNPTLKDRQGFRNWLRKAREWGVSSRW